MFNFWPFKKKQREVPQPSSVKQATSTNKSRTAFGLPEITHYPPMPQVQPARSISETRVDDSSSFVSNLALQQMIYSAEVSTVRNASSSSNSSTINEVPEIKSYSTYTPPSDSDTTSRSSSYDFSSSSSSDGGGSSDSSFGGD